MHFGPFNTQCLFHEAPKTIMEKIIELLHTLKPPFKDIDNFTLRVQTGETVSVESIHGISGYHIVKFSSNTALNDKVIEHLVKS